MRRGIRLCGLFRCEARGRIAVTENEAPCYRSPHPERSTICEIRGQVRVHASQMTCDTRAEPRGLAARILSKAKREASKSNASLTQAAPMFAEATNNLVNMVADTTVSEAVLLTLLAIKHFEKSAALP